MTNDQIAGVAWAIVTLFAGIGLGTLSAVGLEKLWPGCTRRFFKRLFDNDAGLFEPFDKK